MHEREQHVEGIDDAFRRLQSFELPSILVTQGMLLLKVSLKSSVKIRLWIDPEKFEFLYKKVSKNSYHTFMIDDIRAVTPRNLASHYREELNFSKDLEKRWVSITYYNQSKNKLKTLHLVSDTSHDCRRLLYVLGGFQRLKEDVSAHFLVDLKDLDEVQKSLIADKFDTPEKMPKHELTFPEVHRYCKRLNINIEVNQIKEVYERVQVVGKDSIDFRGFKEFVSLLTYRSDIPPIYQAIKGCSKSFTYECFSRFVTEIQKENWDQSKILNLFSRFCDRDASGWAEDNFKSFLASKFCTPSEEEFLDSSYFSHPLNEYFIMSSHNTYLTGRQIAGDSSVEGYVRALRRGCRCIEIDIWNNPQDVDADPIVNHGRTFSNGISLTNVLRTIRGLAFSSTLLPLILSLEVHCSYLSQLKVTKALTEILGDLLLVTPLQNKDSLPSPDELQNRILLKVKQTHVPSAADEYGFNSTSTTTATSQSEGGESTSSSVKSSMKLRRTLTQRVYSALSDLAIYCQGIKFRNFSLPESKLFNHCFSLSEKTANQMMKEPSKAKALRKHNRKYFMRVYPSKVRLMSSNFLPLSYWSHGVQMVATNWQTYDSGQQMNEAFFDKVQGRGFILKPLELRENPIKSKNLIKDAYSKSPLKKYKFSIRLVSAQQLPKFTDDEFINPFAVLEIIGGQNLEWDESSTVGSSRIFPANGFNPTWNENYTGSFCTIDELVFLRITVYFSNSATRIGNPKAIALMMSHFFDIKQGYRYLPLKDFSGEKLLNSTLFLKICYERVD